MKMKPRWMTFLILLGLAVAAASCSGGSQTLEESSEESASSETEEATSDDETETGAVPDSQVASELSESQKLWNELGSENYQFTYTSTCGESAWFTNVPTTVAVNKGIPTMLEGPDYTPELPTVEALHTTIATAETADTVTVTYGQEGQPLQINIDFDASAIDDEFCINITEFQLG